MKSLAMKPLSHSCWNSTVFLQKLCLRSGWHRSAACLAQSVHKKRDRNFHYTDLHTTSTHGKEKLWLTSNFISHNSNSLPTLNKHVLPVYKKGNTLHTWSKCAVLRKYCAGGNLNELYSGHNLIIFRGWSRSSRSDRDDDDRMEYERLEHKYMMERFAFENDMLSRFRNTYIMTLVSIASLQFEITQIPSAIGAVALVTAGLNLAVATLIYVSNLLAFRSSGKLLGTSFSGRVLFAVAHFILWSLVLTLLFPDGDRIDEELKRYTGADN